MTSSNVHHDFEQLDISSDEVKQEGEQEFHDRKPSLENLPFEGAGSREAALHYELETVRSVNQVIEGVLESLKRARSNMSTVSQTVDSASTLLNTWTRILAQTEQNQRLILDPNWHGASQDIADAEADELRRKQEAERRLKEEQERQAMLARQAEEDRRKAEAAASKTTRGTTLRGRTRIGSRIPSTYSATTGRRAPATRPASNASSLTSSRVFNKGVGNYNPRPLSAHNTILNGYEDLESGHRSSGCGCGERLSLGAFETSLPIRVDYEVMIAYLIAPPAGGLFLLMFERKSDYVRFHAWQSSLLFSALWVVHILIAWSSILSSILFVVDVALIVFLALHAYKDVDDVHWPPRSPLDALMSSPNGRRKFRDYQERHGAMQSPVRMGNMLSKSQQQSPRSNAKSSRLREESISDINDDDDDEETLKLKIQALEARLRLKKLQKSKASRDNADTPSRSSDLRPSSSASAENQPTKALDLLPQHRRTSSDTNHDNPIQVPVSPAKKILRPLEPTSPRRFRLGIDKGMKGSEVSLRRRPTVRKDSLFSPSGTTPDAKCTKSYETSQQGPSPRKVKTFSERIAESRAAERLKRGKNEEMQRNRTSAFSFDKKEVDHYKEIAEESKPFSPQKSRGKEEYSRVDVLKAINKPESARRRVASPSHSDDSQGMIPSGQKFEEPEVKKGDPTKFEPFSGLHLSKRILPHTFMKRTLEGKTPMRIPYLLKHVKSPDYELPDTDGDYVIFGVIASKSSPRDHKEKHQTQGEVKMDDDGKNNTKKYMVLTLTDLEWSIDLFLFATAFPRYYKLVPGMVVAILNPNIMAPPPDKIDTGKFSLALNSSDDTILEIGKAQDLGFCKSVKKDGNVCGAWIDARKTEFCEFHIDLQVRKATAQRMAVNHGSGTFGSGGLSGSRTGFSGKGQTGLLDPRGKKIDKETKSTYYIVSRKPALNTPKFGQSAASMLDAEDPFMQNMNISFRRGNENSEERMRKHLADKQRERDIAQMLGQSSKSIGAEYLRAHHLQLSKSGTPSPGQRTNPTLDSSTVSVATSRDPLSIQSSKQAGEVKLGRAKKRTLDPGTGGKKSPIGVKKTRFITAKGIRDAGDSSMSTTQGDYDDDLDIV
ncbi:hypothetical protein KEM54_001260 [Ascosphaera aggregata]|nr:hypothetical protein KEM54_001260 [Ascosphaera aggregata]